MVYRVVNSISGITVETHWRSTRLQAPNLIYRGFLSGLLSAIAVGDASLCGPPLGWCLFLGSTCSASDGMIAYELVPVGVWVRAGLEFVLWSHQ